jgi:hypothetical protein
MANNWAFDDTVAARTRAAAQILGSPELCAIYEGVGGLQEDLMAVRDAGLRAEAMNQAQSEAQAQGKGATATVLEHFGALQREYKAIMAVVQAARSDLARAGAPTKVVASVDQILKDETQVLLRLVPSADETAALRRARAAQTQEAIRAEIHKDACALIQLAAIHPTLEKRRVDSARLVKLQADAAALAGKVAARTALKGGAKLATGGEHAAVAEQKERWASIYRILAAVGRADVRVQALLREAARSPVKAKGAAKAAAKAKLP